MTIRVVCYGLGPIGIGIARLALARAGVEVVGAIDLDPQKIGRDLGALVGTQRCRCNRQRRCDGDAGAGTARGGATRHIISARKGGRAAGTNRQSRRTRGLDL